MDTDRETYSMQSPSKSADLRGIVAVGSHSAATHRRIWVILGLWLGFLLLLGCAMPLSAQASPCRTIGDRAVCISKIQRSAKNYWEYRVVLTVDGVAQPLAVYNCRDRWRVLKDGTVAPFQPEDGGEWVCRAFKRE